MKKIPWLLAASMALTGLPASAASAQSANDYMRYQEATDPGYQSAVRGGGYYNPGYYGGYAQNGQQEGTCILLVICTTHARRNHAGDICYDANGVAYGLDRQGRWYQLPNSAPMRGTPANVGTRCGWNSYGANNNTGGK